MPASMLSARPLLAGRGPVRDLGCQRGSPTHPAWYYNLKAHPRITAEVGAQAFTVLAQELDATARAELWPKLVAEFPGQLDAAQARTTPQFPVFVLTRQD